MSTHHKLALVTGASSGIGRATALHLAANGWRVFGASRRDSTVEGRIEGLRLDVSDAAAVAETLRAWLSETGRIDLLVNNAGFALVAGAEESSETQTKAIFETNVFGAMRVVRAVLPQMRAQGSGRIVNTSSIVGFLPAPFSTLYAASKHALEGWSESLDHEVRTLGIRSILLEPGFTTSDITAHMPEADAKLSAYDEGREAVRAAFAKALEVAPSADLVARAVLRAATTRRPRVRYTIGRDAAALALLRRVMPSAVFERAFRRQFGLPAA